MLPRDNFSLYRIWRDGFFVVDFPLSYVPIVSVTSCLFDRKQSGVLRGLG